MPPSLLDFGICARLKTETNELHPYAERKKGTIRERKKDGGVENKVWKEREREKERERVSE